MFEDAGADDPRVLQIAAHDPPRRLVVFLHGYGATADDLVPVARAVARALPDAELLLPDGFRAAPMGFGRAWWDVRGMNASNRAARMRAAGESLDVWLAAQCAARGLSWSQLSLVGFSQGASLAAWVGARRPLGAAVSLCGRGAELPDGAIATPFLLVTGGADTNVSPDESRGFADALRARGATVNARVHPTLGHAIDGAAVEATVSFLVDPR